MKRYRNPLRHIYDADAIGIQSCFSYNRITHYIIYPELSDAGRLHYHGIIKVNETQKVRLFKHALSKFKSIGMVDLQMIKIGEYNYNKLRWLMYCKKNWQFTHRVLEIEIPIVRLKMEKEIPRICAPQRGKGLSGPRV